jgi:HEPN domain-containing protein
MAINKLEKFQEKEHLYEKAECSLIEAEDHLKRIAYEMSVRRSQEAFELFIKWIFTVLEKEYPKEHDISKEIYGVYGVLKEYDFTNQEVARIVLRSRTLSLWRNPSFYGDEKLGVAIGFNEKEAELALLYVKELHFKCACLKNRFIETLLKQG